jgi:hypothetical protein
MRIRKSALAALTALLGFVVVPIDSPASAVTAPPLLGYGTVVDSHGSPIRDATVVVRAQLRQPGSEDVVVGKTIATGKSTASGEFLLRTSYDPASTNLDADGAMPLEIEVLAGSLDKIFNVNASPPTTTVDSWTWTDVVDDTLLPAAARSGMAAIAHTPLLGLELAMTDANVSADNAVARASYDGLAAYPNAADLAAVRPSALATTGTATVQSTGGSEPTEFDNLGAVDGAGSTDTESAQTTVTRECPTRFVCYVTGDPGPCKSWEDSVWRWVDDAYVKRWLPAQKLIARSKSKMKYAWQNTSNSQFEIAYTGVGSHYAGGLSKAWVEEDSAGIDATLGPNWNGQVNLQWRFQRQRQWCMTTGGYGATYRDSGKRRWMPRNWTGGNQNVRDEWSWHCNPENATHTDNILWAARSSTVRWAQWFAIGGVELDTTQTNSSAHKLSVVPLPGQRVHICGSNGDPVNASAVQELNP